MKNLALNSQQGLIYYETKPTNHQNNQKISQRINQKRTRCEKIVN